jgi:DUF1680 family protein
LRHQDGTYGGEYAQDHAPIREHRTVVGHAVRAMYFYQAAAELARDQNDEALETALEAIWDNLTHRRMYVTGGIGPSAHNEGFTQDFDLPNLSAYAETCASIGLIQWAQSMLESTAKGEYADVIERELYNGALAGIALSGTEYFYDNPLESRGTHNRAAWFRCACCPPNLARLIGNLGRYVVGASESEFFVHQFVGFRARVVLNGTPVTITSKSNYPWSCKITLEIEPAAPAEFSLSVRIPDWADEVSTEVPGAEEEADFRDDYAVFHRVWRPGDTLIIDLNMEPKWIESDPRVRDNIGRVALTNGPIVYCAESVDLGYAPQLLSVDTEPIAEVQWEAGLLGGINSITVEGTHEVEVFTDSLYTAIGTTDFHECSAKFVPYYSWNNRGPNSMQVWVRKF